MSYVKRADEFGLDVSSVRVDFKKVMQRVQQVIKEIEPHDSVERFTGLGVRVLLGAARFVDKSSVAVADKIVHQLRGTHSDVQPLLAASAALPNAEEIGRLIDQTMSGPSDELLPLL